MTDKVHEHGALTGVEPWIHGHTHVPCDYEIHGTRVVCNPCGYPGVSSIGRFLPWLVVEV